MPRSSLVNVSDYKMKLLKRGEICIQPDWNKTMGQGLMKPPDWGLRDWGLQPAPLHTIVHFQFGQTWLSQVLKVVVLTFVLYVYNPHAHTTYHNQLNQSLTKCYNCIFTSLPSFIPFLSLFSFFSKVKGYLFCLHSCYNPAFFPVIHMYKSIP
jgi:hypothetical protein